MVTLFNLPKTISSELLRSVIVEIVYSAQSDGRFWYVVCLLGFNHNLHYLFISNIQDVMVILQGSDITNIYSFFIA